jgi:hypothetical protein
MIDGFYKYKAKPELVKKINAIRINQSRPDLCGVPILQPGQVSFSSANASHGEPRSCYNCIMFNYGKSCSILPKHIEVHKFTSPEKREDNAKPIEFWPVCDYWVFGQPNYGPATFKAAIDPGDAGLCWINAPEVGQESGGACCGGRNGGDDCDFWLIDSESGDKRKEPTGFCRVLQRDTGNLDCCSCWIDDDILEWQMVQERFRQRGSQ